MFFQYGLLEQARNARVDILHDEIMSIVNFFQGVFMEAQSNYMSISEMIEQNVVV